MIQTLPAILVSLASFAALLWIADRKRGTVVAQGVLVAGAVVFFVAIAAGPAADPGAWLAPRGIATFAVGLLAAGAGGMLYHLYLGRFAELRVARMVFVAVYLALAAVFALVFLSLI